MNKVKTACCYLCMVIHISVSMCLYFQLAGCLENSLVEFQLFNVSTNKTLDGLLSFDFYFEG